ncbi:MAG TPA: helix-turn-helix domain-containing protein [Candidatus Bacteroides merdipullorum]|uniref:Helix-turn-helix domain-containing protein n=1 Tax=Candidatus Bacteroides merdipullorum TaxID=2838474 RepID=A0A9D2CWW5_9BACE|nr:helix-turn-helix domain-containing protein [Candidatus Bacteroides merdipullorum]
MKIVTADNIQQYNQFFGVKTLHPQVGIIHFNRSENQPTHKMTFGFYALYLVKTVGITMDYGKTQYDFNDGTVICLAPGQTIGVHRMPGGPVPEAIGLMFHPDLLYGTTLAQRIKQFTFFSYTSNEALHLSSDECGIIQNYMEHIERELNHPIDNFSRQLFVSNIEVLLNYCMRFYERQFASREKLNNDVLARFEQLLNGYWDSGAAKLHGLPTVKYFADKLCLSPNYFGDLIKSVAGRSAQECIQSQITEMAKEAILNPRLNTKQIADMLGFQYPQHFSRFFKKQVGCTPKEYRAMT